MNEKDFTREREELTKTYSELGDDLKKSQWGVSEYKGELVKNYTNPELIQDVFTNEVEDWLKDKKISKDQAIKIVDFGGGDGILINTIIQQLNEAGYDKATGVNLDFTEKSLKKMKTDYIKKIDDLYAIQGDISQIPIKEKSVDVGVSRYMLQYFGKEKQKDILGKILGTMKPGSELIIQLPAAGETNKQAQLINEFHNKINAIVAGSSFEEVMENKYFPALEDLRKIADELGVECTATFVDGFKFPISAESYFDRFQITDENKKEEIRKIFDDENFKNRLSKIGGIKFTEEDGIIYAEIPDAKVIFKK